MLLFWTTVICVVLAFWMMAPGDAERPRVIHSKMLGAKQITVSTIPISANSGIRNVYLELVDRGTVVDSRQFVVGSPLVKQKSTELKSFHLLTLEPVGFDPEKDRRVRIAFDLTSNEIIIEGRGDRFGLLMAKAILKSVK